MLGRRGAGDVVGKERADHAPWHAKWDKMSPTALAHPIDTLIGRDDLTPRLKELTCPSIVSVPTRPA